ncbi:MAG: hypothetical protein K9J13_06135, partial [Saprospiraceae bacterium]|nr:hypothetical protein [Saprospiraceae bacterium]
DLSHGERTDLCKSENPIVFKRTRSPLEKERGKVGVSYELAIMLVCRNPLSTVTDKCRRDFPTLAFCPIVKAWVLMPEIFQVLQSVFHSFEVGSKRADVILPDDDAALPDVDAALPDIDADLPDVDADLPDIDAVLPDDDADLPDIDAVLPDADAVLPDVDTALPYIDAVLPDAGE